MIAIALESLAQRTVARRVRHAPADARDVLEGVAGARAAQHRQRALLHLEKHRERAEDTFDTM